MTEEELEALAELLRRAPMTQAERLWVLVLLARLKAQAMQAQKEKDNDGKG